VEVDASQGIEHLTLLPPTPALPNEDPATVSCRTSRLIQYSTSAENYDNQGRLVSQMNAIKCSDNLFAELKSNDLKRQKTSGGSDILNPVDPIADQYRKALTNNAEKLQSMLQVAEVPEPQRKALQTALHNSMKDTAAQLPAPAPSLLLTLVWDLFKEGKFPCPCASLPPNTLKTLLAAAPSEKANKAAKSSGSRGGSSQASTSSGTSSVSSSSSSVKFKFEPAKHTRHRKPHGPASRYCPDCVAHALAAGSMTLADNPPSECWFANNDALKAHQAACPHKA
jgi:hypothetical protein